MSRPNILLILTDDQGWGDVSLHGNEILQTPNMDRIATEGARFDRFFVSPVCAPTRASLLTGRYHLSTGVHGVTRGRETMRAEEITIAEILQENGYATGIFGKWHNGAHYPNHPNGQGFDEFVGFCAGHWNNYFDTTLEHNGDEFESTGYIADVLTDAAVAFIEQNKNRPFFCYVPYNTPHTPFQVPDSYFATCKAKGLDDELACVYGMCENLDDNIGRLLNKLQDLGLTDNTIVIFTTDNGPNTERYNGNMRGRKGSPHEGGSRVPLFIRWPEHIKAGIVVEHIAAHIDILPTLIDLLDLPEPKTLPLDGISLAPLLDNPAIEWPDRKIYGHWGEAASIRTEQYRFIYRPGAMMLFDMLTDSGETRDIAREHPEITNALFREAAAWWAHARQLNAAYPPAIPVGYENQPLVVLPGHEALLDIKQENGIGYNDPNGWANDWITNWVDSTSYPFWWIDVIDEAEYDISIDYTCSEKNLGTEFKIFIGNQFIEGAITESFDPEPLPSPDRVPRKEVYEKVWKTVPVGQMTIPEGKHRLEIHAFAIPGDMAMDIKAVRIRKI
ncbi:arylsulfatase [candidate division KSB1 bacterium]|nr:arylsulfatase [candidate division KSB1 bacterium]